MVVDWSHPPMRCQVDLEKQTSPIKLGVCTVKNNSIKGYIPGRTVVCDL